MVRKVDQIIRRGPKRGWSASTSAAIRKPEGASTLANSFMVGCGPRRPT